MDDGWVGGWTGGWTLDAHTNTDTMSSLLSRLPGFPLTGTPHDLWAQTEQLPCPLYVCSPSPAHLEQGALGQATSSRAWTTTLGPQLKPNPLAGFPNPSLPGLSVPPGLPSSRSPQTVGPCHFPQIAPPAYPSLSPFPHLEHLSPHPSFSAQ